MNREHDPKRVARTRRSWEARMMRGSIIVSTGLLASVLCLHGSVRAQDGKKSQPDGADSATAQQAARDALAKHEKPGETWKEYMECKVALAKAGPEAIPVLLDALKTGSPASRGLAYEALGFLASEKFQPAIEKLRPGLLQAALDKDRDVRLTAIHLLGRLGRIESKPKYLEIADKDPSGHVQFEMKFALTRDDKPNPEAIRKALSSYDLTRMDSAHLDKAAPDFEIADTTGKVWRLRDFRGKKSVVLVFLIFIN
jgi:HEAT repeats